LDVKPERKTIKGIRKEEKERRIAEGKAAEAVYDPMYNKYAARQYELLPVRLKYPTKWFDRLAWNQMGTAFHHGLQNDVFICWCFGVFRYRL